MQMWDLLKHQHPSKFTGNRKTISGGFTLLEMLVVMFIVGLSASLVLPNMAALYDRLSYALERDTFIRNLNDLPRAAMDNNQDLVLVGEYSSSDFGSFNDTAPEFVSAEDLEIRVPYRNSIIRPSKLEVPDNWTVSIPEPIFFRSSGFCSGGRILIDTKYLSYVMSAKAPYCLFSEEPG